MISERLKTIASMVNTKNVIDIGCDHGLLDIYLVNTKNVSCVASDINEKALSKAIENVHKYGYNNKIKTIVSDGLDKITVENNTTIVISGMGTSTIKHILSNEKSLNAEKIIIQSNNELYELRLFMLKKGFIIDEEKALKEKNIYYVIISFIKGNIKYNKEKLYIGPKIIQNYKFYQDYLIYLKQKEVLKLKKIPKKYFILRLKTYIKLKKIMRYII